MINTADIDIRTLLDELEEPLIHVVDVITDDDPEDGFDGLCVQHEGCRAIL